MDGAIDNGQRSSYLSSNVKKLVCFQPDDLAESGRFDDIFFEDGMLNWNAIESICSLNECFSESGISDYITAFSRLHPVSIEVHDVIHQLTRDEFELKYGNHLKWTTKSQLLIQCFDLLKSHPGCFLTSLLLLTSTLERILGDIFITCSRGAVACPLLLKDLLKTQELRSVLGESVMFCLQMYIGSPCGLNLRNLAWHGFLSEGELPEHYVSFLLMLTISLDEIMKVYSKPAHNEGINERSLIKYSEISVMRDYFPNVESEDLRELFSKSWFVTTSMAKIWHLVLDCLQQEKYVYVVMLLLPQLEHSLRRMYASVNDMPERIQTAESAEFYTTFNEILSPVLADGTPNKLLEFLEPRNIELLLDILVHPEGPRLRDHLSHGEVDIFHFPKYLANHVLCIAVAFCVRFCPEEFSRIDALAEISKLTQEYSSIFHPFSSFQREFSTLICSLLEWKNIRQPCEDEFRKCSGDLYAKDSWESMVNAIWKQASLTGSSAGTAYGYSYRESTKICDENVLKLMLKVLAGSKLKTLFRPRYELEIVALLRQVVGHCFLTSDQVQQTSKVRYSEWENKILRSRQRNNYKRFWFHLPFIAQTLCLLAVVVGSEFEYINNLAGSDTKKTKFLKKCLQCSENLASLSSSSRNRWLECSEVSKIWLNQVSTFYDH